MKATDTTELIGVGDMCLCWSCGEVSTCGRVAHLTIDNADDVRTTADLPVCRECSRRPDRLIFPQITTRCAAALRERERSQTRH